MTIQNLINAQPTRTRAAEVAGVHRKTIHNWLNGKSEPTLTQGLRLCRAAGVDPLTVRDADEEPQPPH